MLQVLLVGDGHLKLDEHHEQRNSQQLPALLEVTGKCITLSHTTPEVLRGPIRLARMHDRPNAAAESPAYTTQVKPESKNSIVAAHVLCGTVALGPKAHDRQAVPLKSGLIYAITVLDEFNEPKNHRQPPFAMQKRQK